MQLGEFVRDSVYPVVDAVAAGWLDHLNPKTQSSGAYALDCPNCKKSGRAYYYAGRSHVVCNRKNECHSKAPSLSLWDILANNGYSNSEILSLLCEEAGINPPSDNDADTQLLAPSAAIIEVTREFAKQNSSTLNQFAVERNLSAEDLETINLGYYPSAVQVQAALRKREVDLVKCMELGFLPEEHNSDPFAGRIVGFWKQEDGSVRLWGRYPRKQADKQHTGKKYHFSSGLKKSLPYLAREYAQGPTVAVEGPLDAWSLRMAGEYKGIGLGGALITESQAVCLRAAGIKSIIHMIDPDTAGYQGALLSIKNGAKTGIQVAVAVLAKGMGDVDELRAAGRSDLISAAISKAIPPGEFVARIYMKASQTGEKHTASQARSVSRCLVLEDRIQFQTICSECGVELTEEVEALRTAATLIESGMDTKKALGIVSRDYELTISITPSV